MEIFNLLFPEDDFVVHLAEFVRFRSLSKAVCKVVNQIVENKYKYFQEHIDTQRRQSFTRKSVHPFPSS